VTTAKIDYARVQSVAGQLNTAKTELVTKIAGLQNTVAALLSTGGGLYMEHTSPSLQDAYSQFTATLTNAMNGISNFADQFNNIAKQLADMDTQMSSDIQKNSGGGGGN
jgi:uncharacterized protein YukE